jgi:hypothetical protein
MLKEVRPEEFEMGDLERFHEECVDQMSGDPNLTDEEKRELLRQLQLPDDEWEPIELPEGSEPVSATIIKTRRGSKV